MSHLVFSFPLPTARIKAEYAQRRQVLHERIASLEKENASLIEQADVGGTPDESLSIRDVSSVVPRDFSTIPNDLDARFEAEDPDGALRPTIINAAKVWSKRSQHALLAPPSNRTLSVDEQKLEKQACWDLLDSLTRSGGLPFEGGQMHIVVASTHCFEKSVFDTLIKDNVNPIERVEQSSLIVASVVHSKPASELTK